MDSESSALIGAFKEELYCDLDQRISDVCQSLLSQIAEHTASATPTRGKRRAKPDILALIENGFNALRTSCREEIDRRVQDLRTYVTARNPSSRPVSAAGDQCDSRSSGLGLQMAAASLVSGQEASLDRRDQEPRIRDSLSMARQPQHHCPPLRAAAEEAEQPDARQTPIITPSSRPNPGTAETQRDRGQTPRVHLDSNDLGDNLISNLARAISAPGFRLPLSITLSIDWKQVVKDICPAADYYRLAVNYHRLAGVLRMRTSTGVKFCPLDLDTVVKKPSDPEQCYERLLQHPPRGNIPYYVGPLPQSPLDSLFKSGISELGSVPGVTTLYGHSGERGSGTPFHCEDVNLRSYNLVLFGYKLWILIDTQDTTRFEELAERIDPTKGGRLLCNQFIGHKCMMLTLATLRAEGIRFETVCAGPGDMITTSPRQYHLVVNLTASFAVATNYILPGEQPIPPRTRVCPGCGLFALPHRNLKQVSDSDGEPDGGVAATLNTLKKRKDAGAMLPANTCAKRTKITMGLAQSARLRPLVEVMGQLRKVDKHCIIPAYNNDPPPRPEILKLCAAVQSRAAVRQLCSLIKAKRAMDIEQRPAMRPAHALQRSIQELTSRGMQGDLEKFRKRLAQVDYAEAIRVARNGAERTLPRVIEKYRQTTGIPKRTLDHHRCTGEKWKAAIGPYDGLLSFIFLSKFNVFEIPPTCFQLDGADLESFHAILDKTYIGALCCAGKAFESSLRSAIDVDFRWESQTKNICWETCEREELLSLLQPLPFTDQNIFDPDAFPRWDRPTGWPVDQPWPVDPTALLDVDKQCDYCQDPVCECPNTVPDITPRIKFYGDDKGRGLQAVASVAGGIAYKKGSFLGVLAGRVVPAAEYADSWAIDFRRPDLPDEPVVCQLHVADVGNIFRLLNHAKNPCAQLLVRRRKGRYVMAVEARRDIMDAEEITVSYRSGD